MSAKGHRVSHRKNAALHADHGCRWSTRPVLGALVDLTGAAADRACKLPGCRRLFALAQVEAAQDRNDATASSPYRWATERRLIAVVEELADDTTRARRDDLATRIRATMAGSGAYLPTAA